MSREAEGGATDTTALACETQKEKEQIIMLTKDEVRSKMSADFNREVFKKHHITKDAMNLVKELCKNVLSGTDFPTFVIFAVELEMFISGMLDAASKKTDLVAEMRRVLRLSEEEALAEISEKLTEDKNETID